MVKIKKKICTVALAMILSGGTLLSSGVFSNVNVVHAATSATVSSQANSAIQSLEGSLERNYLGSKNLPSFNTYLKKAKDLTAKLPNGSVKTSYNNRIAETERIIKATENVVSLENSLDKNYHGVSNLKTFNTYLDKANKSIALVNTAVCKAKMSDRTYLAFNIIRDIEVVNTSQYKAAANDFVEARKLYRTAVNDKTTESKNKALEKANSSLSLVWKVNSSVAKDYLAKDIKALVSDINKIEAKEPVKVPVKDENSTENNTKTTNN